MVGTCEGVYLSSLACRNGYNHIVHTYLHYYMIKFFGLIPVITSDESSNGAEKAMRKMTQVRPGCASKAIVCGQVCGGTPEETENYMTSLRFSATLSEWFASQHLPIGTNGSPPHDTSTLRRTQLHSQIISLLCGRSIKTKTGSI